MRLFILVLFVIASVDARRVSSKKNLRTLEGKSLLGVFEGDGPVDEDLDKLVRVIEETERKEEKVAEGAAKGKCWSFCDEGECQWSWSGCHCVCDDNFEGNCCNKMTRCGADTETCCPRDNLKSESRKCSTLQEDVKAGKTLVLGTAAMGLPEDRQGLFWLTRQGAKSSLMSFARTRDGCGIATCPGNDCAQTFTEANPFRIRVAGDRTWSDGGGFDSTTFKAAAAIDLVYNFFLEGEGKMVIVPQITRSFFNIKVARWLMEFRADLLDPSKVEEHKSPYTTKADGSRNSIVWRRNSNALGGTQQIGGAAEYDLVQVLDGDGNKIQPAYNDFLASCKSAEATYEVDHDASKYKGGEKPGKRIVYGRGAAKAANDEYYFRVADGKFE